MLNYDILCYIMFILHYKMCMTVSLHLRYQGGIDMVLALVSFLLSSACFFASGCNRLDDGPEVSDSSRML